MASSSARAVIASKRAAQNRAAQRAFRQRRERYIKDLERRVKEMASWPEEIEHLRFENKHLKEHVSILLRQISALTSQQMTPPLSSASSAGSCDAAATNSSSSYHTYPAHPPVQHITQEPMAQMTVQQDLANYYQHIHPPPYNYDTLAEQETALFYHRDINMSVKNSTQQPPSYQHVSQQQQHNSWNMNDFNLDLPFAIM
ncbi:hypothetical protein LRAMOSA00321 [Lichtheimia ramosa]|uniref:BZIP domain-containing protein n=1 Tax=Lichtheimia ramosa TaxID=688394 RepID=A0A077W8Q6_9FUNG|nr:hypothetical protein LRAMOSA00321 [Lichtheimia ramosa]